MSGQEWTTRLHSTTDGKRILRLLNSTFGSWGNLEKWEWKYNPPLEKPRPIIGIAEGDGGKVVGHWAVLPVSMKAKDTIVVGSQAVDAATHQDFRKTGIFSELVPSVLNGARESGVPITYGVAEGFVADAYLRRHGWVLVDSISNLMLILDYEAVVRERLGNELAFQAARGLLKTRHHLLHGISHLQKKNHNDTTISQVKRFGSGIDHIWEKASEAFDVVTVRDSDYLNWRFVDCPDTRYRIWIAKNGGDEVGYVVAKYSEQDRSGHIMDFQVHPDFLSTAHSLILTAVGFLEMMNMSWVQCWMPRFSPYYRYLRLSGFMKARTALKLVCHVNSPDSLSLPPRPRWFLTLGDSDVV